MSTQATETEAIKRSVTVDCSVEHAFETFTERIHEWWPLGKHSIDQYESGSPAETVVFQGGAGGQIYERTSKGEELKWADVSPTSLPTGSCSRGARAASRTAEDGDRGHLHRRGGGKTRVDLEHRGWEGLGAAAAEARQGYSEGWESVLAGYAERRTASAEPNSASASGAAPTCCRPSFVTTRPRGVRCRKPSWSRYGS